MLYLTVLSTGSQPIFLLPISVCDRHRSKFNAALLMAESYRSDVADCCSTSRIPYRQSLGETCPKRQDFWTFTQSRPILNQGACKTSAIAVILQLTRHQVLITIMASVGSYSAYATDIIAVQKVYYNQNYNFGCTSTTLSTKFLHLIHICRPMDGGDVDTAHWILYRWYCPTIPCATTFHE